MLFNQGITTMKTYRSFIALLVVLGSANLSAQNLHTTFQITPYVDIHGYSWKEFDNAGAELLKESGPRFSFGVVPRFSFLQKKNLYTEMDFRYALGTVDYDGFVQDQTGARTPFTTQTVYAGFKLSATIGYNAELSRTFEVTPVVGFGYEFWKRDLANGGPNGYDEKYTVVLGSAGVIGTYVLTPNAQFFSAFLLEFPFSISESIDRYPRVNTTHFNIELSPGNNPRFIVQAGASVYRVLGVLYFETWTLSKSPDVQGGLHQPESTRKYFGIKVGYTIGVM
jgi:hypothetical protein